jgi:hypothetical protein
MLPLAKSLRSAALLAATCLPAITTPATVTYSLALGNDGAVTVTAPDGARAVFQPLVTTLFSAKNPHLSTRWGSYKDKGLSSGDTGSTYHVLTWGADAAKVAATGHVADGYDPDADRGYGAGRTANLFRAGETAVLRASAWREENGKITWEFPATAGAALTATLETAGAEPPRLTLRADIRKTGHWSFGYTGAPAVNPAKMDEVWQPLVYTGRRFPEDSFLEAAFRCPLATALVASGGVTTGVMADPSELPFQPLPNLDNSRFGVSARNLSGDAQPLLFAPIMGGRGSRMAKGTAFAFAARLIVSKQDISHTAESVARQVWGFGDFRHNALGSLNTTFDNMVAFGMSHYARFNSELRGFAYDTDVPGSVKNVSSLHPFSVALVTDSREIYERLVYPQVEYFISRERFLFSIHPDAKGQGVSTKLGGLGAPLNEYATLYAMTGKRTPFLKNAALALQKTDRSLNLDSVLRGSWWGNSLALWRATGDPAWLEKATTDADAYIQSRVLAPQTNFEDPDSRGLFFWTSFAPQWVELWELYEATGEPRHLDAALRGARNFILYTWMSPRVPDGKITVNKGGVAPSYRKGPKWTPLKATEEDVDAWLLSEMGLTPESSGTSRGHRAILLANFAPWLLRVAAASGDNLPRDVARSAVIGRYTSFPGYHINTARTSVFQKPDYAERPMSELNASTSIHYNHIWPHIAMLLDYLVSDAFDKSAGKVDFPGRYAEGYAYLQQKIYGDRPGKIFGLDNLWLWMPRDVVRVTHPELNYITARGDGCFAVVLTNQCKQPVRSQVILNNALVGLPENTEGVRAEILDAKGNASAARVNAAGSVLVDVAPESLAVLLVRGVTPKVGFQREMTGSGGAKLPENGSVCELGWRGARAVALLLGPREPARVYAYIPDFDREIASCVLRHRQGAGEWTALPDDRYPFEFTLPANGSDPLEFFIEATLKDGRTEKSPVGKVLLR